MEGERERGKGGGQTMFIEVVSSVRFDKLATLAAPSSLPNSFTASSIHLSTSSASAISILDIRILLLCLSPLYACQIINLDRAG
jgi:hypothetical protein